MNINMKGKNINSSDVKNISKKEKILKMKELCLEL